MPRAIIAVLVSLLALASPAPAESVQGENIVVTPALVREKESEASSPVTVIRRQEMERTGLVFLDDLLRSIGVVQVLREGASGAPSSLLVRGADPFRSVILIDGVRVASAFDGYLDLSGITLSDVERIEIARGAHSVSYGSQAMGGVVNIITRKGGGEFRAGLSYGAGANGLKAPSVSVSGGRKYRYRLSASAPESEGESSIKYGAEPDGFELRAYSGHMSLPIGRGGVLEVSGRRSVMERSLDREPALVASGLADDADLREERERELFMTRLTYSSTAAIVHTVTASEWEETGLMHDPTYSFFNTVTSTLEGVAEYQREGFTRTRAYEYRANIYEREGGVGIIGVERREETAVLAINSGAPGGFENTVAVNAAFMNLKMEDGPYTFVFGARRTEHEVSGDHVTYRVSAFQHDKGSTLRYRAAWATGLRLPTSLELELSASETLAPELSRSWEAGFEKLFGKGRKAGIMYFEQELADLIERDPVSGIPANRGSADIRGVEAVIGSRGKAKTHWSLSYTWIEAENPVTGEPLPHRPEDRVDLGVGYGGDSLGLQLDYSYVGSRPPIVTGENLGSYSMLNIAGTFRLGKTFVVYGRADNILDEEYEDVSGYGAQGREYHAGLKASF